MGNCGSKPANEPLPPSAPQPQPVVPPSAASESAAAPPESAQKDSVLVAVAPQATASAASEPAPAPAAAAATPASLSEPTPQIIPNNNMSAAPKAKIAVVFYSMYGHVATMAKNVAKGVEEAGAEVKLFQVAETLSADVLGLMHAPAKDASIPVIEDPSELADYDGIIFGCGTRFGMIAAQMKAFFDRTGGVWAKGGWVGKTAGIFFSTGTQGGGQETTALTCLTQFTHHGMVYIPIGYSNPALFNMDEIHGGSPYGAGTFAGPTGARQPTELELGLALHQGKHIATITSALKKGKALSA